MKINKLIIVMLLLLFFSCTKQDDSEIESIVEINASYMLTVTGKWSESSHPIDYPSNSHFSSIVGMIHKSEVSLFTNGELASTGIWVMAETGDTSYLEDEINSIVSSGLASNLIKESSLGTGTAVISFDIEVTKEFSFVSLVSMIAPSPDWFVGVENVNLYKNGLFIDEIQMNAIAYDSGTDSGLTFTSVNMDTNPAENIFKITSSPLGNGTIVEPHLLTVKFEKLRSN